MQIVIDERENALYEILTQKNQTSIPIIKRVIQIGDILIQNAAEETVLIIERKSFPDLLASIRDGRYKEQSYRLATTSGLEPHSILYLLEGMTNGISPENRELIYSAVCSLNVYKGFSVFRTCSVAETADFIVSLTKKIQRETEKGTKKGITEKNYCSMVIKKAKNENITPDNIGEIFLCQIPGISSQSAIAIMKEFRGNFPDLVEYIKGSDLSRLSAIVLENGEKKRKMGKNIVENLKKYLGGTAKEKDIKMIT